MPRQLRPDSVRIENATCRVPWTMIGPTAPHMMCQNMVRVGPLPIDPAALAGVLETT